MGKEKPRKKDPVDGITQAERIFCYNFLITGSQRESARVAWGCKTDTLADLFGHRAMKKHRVIEYLAGLRESSQGSPQEVCQQAKDTIKELALICFSDPKNYVDALGLPDQIKEKIKAMGPESRAISEIEVEETGTEVKTTKVKFKFHSKMAALNLLGKHHKLYTDLLEHTGNIVAPVIYQLPDNGMGPKKE